MIVDPDDYYGTDPEHRRRWVVLVDGQRDQIKRVQRAARKLGLDVTIVLDVVHVLEDVWAAAYAFHAAGTEEAETWVRPRCWPCSTVAAPATSARACAAWSSAMVSTRRPPHR